MLTQGSKPEGETHRSCRTRAKGTGVRAATVQRVWHATGLKPHLLENFKLSNDKRFEEKLVDVAELYMDPPEKAVAYAWAKSADPGPRPHPAVVADEDAPGGDGDP
jgi:hypothetical protein